MAVALLDKELEEVDNRLSAVIITKNEAGYIEKCLDSVAFANEIVVVDSFSTDGTWEILTQDRRVRALQHPFQNFTAQKNFALGQAKGPWIYFLDADERVTPALEQEIKRVITKPEAHSAYWNYRSFMYKNKRLYFSGWQTDKVYRLFKKEACHFTDKRIVHETLEVKGTEGFLKEKLLHYSYKDYEDYKSKMLKYGRMKAKEAYGKGRRWNPVAQLLRPVWKFFNHYFLRLGILDGRKGMIICYLNALGVWERYRELRRIQQD